MPGNSNLIEPEFRNFITRSLQDSYTYRQASYDFAVNFLVGAAMFAVLAAFFVYKWQRRVSPAERERASRELFQRNVAAIRRIQMQQTEALPGGAITGMPNWRNEYEAILQGQSFYR